MHKIKLILLLILPLSVLGQDLGIIDTKTTKNPAINGTHRISTDGKNLFFRNFFGLSRKVANTDSAVFTNGIKVNSGVNNVEIDQTQIMFRRTNGTTMTIGNYRAYSHQFFTNASFSGLTQAMSINNYGQVIVGNQILDGISNPTVKFQVGATAEARQRIISQASSATLELSGATGGTISNTTGNLNYLSAGNHVFNSKVILPDSTRIGIVSATELGYLDGVTSSIQTQLNNKAPITSPTFITDATTPRLKITGAGDVGKGSDLVMGGNSNDLTMHGTGKVILGTGGFQRLVVTNAGNVGVGTTAPTSKFEVSGLAGFRYNDGKQADGKYLRSNSTGVAAWDSVKVSEVFGLNTTYLPINNPTATGTLTVPNILTGVSVNSGAFSLRNLQSSAFVNDFIIQGLASNTYLGNYQNFPLGLYTNNTERMRIFANGNVGIGTTTDAGYKLDVNGTARFVNGVNLATTSGNVGIGTASPIFGLDIRSTNQYGRPSFGGTSADATRWAYFLNPINSGQFFDLMRSNNVDFRILTESTIGGGAASQLIVKSTGNVGIGTDSPNSKLEVSGGGASATDGAIRLTNTVSSQTFGIINGIIGINNIGFSIRDITNSIDRIVINGSGNVGIGTTTDAGYKLDVNGDINIPQTSNYKIAGNPFLQRNTHFWNYIYDFSNNVALQLGGTPDPVNYSNNTQHIFRSRAGSEYMRIDANGRLGIGTTTPNAPLQFSNAVSNRKVVLFEDTNNDHKFFGFGINLGVLRYQVNETASDHVFFAGTSATTSTELLRIKGNGNVGIGTTTPLTKFHVKWTGTNSDGLYTPAIISTDGKTVGDGIGLAFYGHNSANNEKNYGSLNYFITNPTTGAESSELTIRTLNGGSNGDRIKVTSSGNTLIGTTTDAGFKLEVNGTTRLNGNVSIGTTSNARTLSVQTTTNDVNIEGINSRTTGDNYAVRGISDGIGASLNMGGFFTARGATSNHGLRIYDVTEGASSYSLYSDSPAKSYFQGSVGIGTTTPNAPLQFANNTQNRKIVLYENANNEHDFYGFGVNSGILRYQTGIGANHVFYAGATTTTSNELMRIQSNGNVGIGTTAPTQKFEVRNDINADVAIRIENRGAIANGTSNSLIFGGYRDTESIYDVAKISAIHKQGTAGNANHAGELAFYTQLASALTNPDPVVERMRISSTGNVGIGTTTPAASAILDITSTTKGVLFPRLTTPEINAIASPANGLTVYNTTLSVLCFYDGAASTWKKVSHSNMQ